MPRLNDSLTASVLCGLSAAVFCQSCFMLQLAPAARHRAGRILLQRLRKSQSTTVLYGEPENALEQLQLQDGSSNFFPQVEGGGTQVWR